MKKSTHIIPIYPNTIRMLLLNSHHIPMKKPVTGVSAIPTAHGHGIGTTTPDWEDHGTKTMGQP